VNITLIIALLAVGFSNSACGTMIEYPSDPYIEQAPVEVTRLVEEAANRMGFVGAYEVVVPTKAGIQMAPIRQFIGSCPNPITQNLAITINPSWFMNIPYEQQLFLLSTYFVKAQHGESDIYMKMVPWLFVCISLLLALGAFIVLRKTRLNQYKLWVSIVAAIAFAIVCELCVLDAFEAKMLHYYMIRHNVHLREIVIATLGDRDAAIKACQMYDLALKDAIKDGATSLMPHKNTYAEIADALKK